jgi:hypothetical protein
MYRSITVATLSVALKAFKISNFEQLFHAQVAVDSEQAVCELVLRYDQYVLMD